MQVKPKKMTLQRLSLHSLCNEYDLCETEREPNNNFRLDNPTPAETELQKPRTSLIEKNKADNFAVYLIGKVYPWRDSCLALLSYKDLMRLEATSKTIRHIIQGHKLSRRLVRFGNLDPQLRPAFWCKILLPKNYERKLS